MIRLFDMEKTRSCHLNIKTNKMKLSNILIAALVTTCVATTAQTTDKNKGDKPKVKTEKKIKKSKTKPNATCLKPEAQINPDSNTHRVCPACGRG